MNPRGWIGLRLESDLSDTEIRSLIRQSYDMVRNGKGKSKAKNRSRM